MKLIGLMPVRNEAWILGLSLRAALQWCDAAVVFQHACTDNTQEIIWDVEEEHPGKIINMSSSLEDWHEMAQRESMLVKAREFGATHLALIDADEILTGNMLHENASNVRLNILEMPKGHILQLPLYNLRGSLDRYHSNGIWGKRWLSVAFADDPKLSWSGDKFHAREPRYPDNRLLKPYRPIQQGEGGTLHLWGASERRLVARHALYKCVERIRYPDKPVQDIERMYNLWRSPEDSRVMWPDHLEFQKPWTYANVPLEWWTAHGMRDSLIELNGELWQEAEVRRLVHEHGIQTFQHLDLFGVA